ncbi:MAG: lysophospholipid acyltransferase family protein [Planctomycetota bacterium]|nr:lysophospholipid acyltransferase family protein [Planctomycetota bacterium]
MSESIPSLLPPSLRQDWPVPRQDALGERGGAMAWLEYAAGRGALGVLSRLPDGPREAFIGAFARLAVRVDRSHSDAARDFLRTAFGPSISHAELEERVLQAWRHFLRITIESSGFAHRVDFADLGAHLDGVDLHPDAEKLRADKKGAIFVTGHLGDWEAGSAALAYLGFDPFYAVVKAPKNRPLSAHLQRLREARGLRSLPRRGAMQHASQILRGGGYLGMVLDQRARKRPVLAPFFGRPARCDRSAGVLMKRLRTPVLIGFCYRTAPWRWRVHVPTVIHPEELVGVDPDAIVARLNREFETAIRAMPDQYMWIHDRYRGTDPAALALEEAAAETPGSEG